VVGPAGTTLKAVWKKLEVYEPASSNNNRPHPLTKRSFMRLKRWAEQPLRQPSCLARQGMQRSRLGFCLNQMQVMLSIPSAGSSFQRCPDMERAKAFYSAVFQVR